MKYIIIIMILMSIIYGCINKTTESSNESKIVTFAKKNVKDGISRAHGRYSPFKWKVIDTIDINSLNLRMYKFREEGIFSFYVMQNLENDYKQILSINEFSTHEKTAPNFNFLISSDIGFDMKGIENYLDYNYGLDTTKAFLEGLDTLFRLYINDGDLSYPSITRLTDKKDVTNTFIKRLETCPTFEKLYNDSIYRNEFMSDYSSFKNFLLVLVEDKMSYIYIDSLCSFYVFKVNFRGYKNFSIDWVERDDTIRNYNYNYRINMYTF